MSKTLQFRGSTVTFRGTTVNLGIEDRKIGPCRLSQRLQGVAIVTFGIIWISPDSLLIRLAEDEHGSDGCLVFWKFLFKLSATTLGLLVSFGGPRELLRQTWEGGRYVACAGLFEGTTESLFVIAITKTTSANVLILLNANTIWCGLLGVMFLGDRPPKHTVATIIIGFCCILIVFLGARLGSEDDDEEEGSLVGDVAALGSGIALAIYLTICRYAGDKMPDLSMVPSMCVGSVLALILGVVMAEGSVGSECSPESGFWGWSYIFIDGAIVIPVSLATFAIGPKYILAAEAALIMLLEVMLGPLWVWIGLGEVPGVWTFVGGGLFLLAIATHELHCLRLDMAKAKARAKKARFKKANTALSTAPKLKKHGSMYRSSFLSQHWDEEESDDDDEPQMSTIAEVPEDGKEEAIQEERKETGAKLAVQDGQGGGSDIDAIARDTVATGAAYGDASDEEITDELGETFV